MKFLCELPHASRGPRLRSNPRSRQPQYAQTEPRPAVKMGGCCALGLQGARKDLRKGGASVLPKRTAPQGALAPEAALFQGLKAIHPCANPTAGLTPPPFQNYVWFRLLIRLSAGGHCYPALAQAQGVRSRGEVALWADVPNGKDSWGCLAAGGGSPLFPSRP